MTTPEAPALDEGAIIHPAIMLPAEMLALHDKVMSGAGLNSHERKAADAIYLAAAFGSAAFMGAMDSDQGTAAMLRAFLTALVDPMPPDLDYLRRDPAAAAAARGAA